MAFGITMIVKTVTSMPKQLKETRLTLQSISFLRHLKKENFWNLPVLIWKETVRGILRKILVLLLINFLTVIVPALFTIAAHKLSDEIAPGTLNSIFKQAQIDKR